MSNGALKGLLAVAVVGCVGLGVALNNANQEKAAAVQDAASKTDGLPELNWRLQSAVPPGIGFYNIFIFNNTLQSKNSITVFFYFISMINRIFSIGFYDITNKRNIGYFIFRDYVYKFLITI